MGKAKEPTLKEESSWAFSSLDENIRLGRKLIKLTNTLAYYDTKSITVVKIYRVQALETA
jgi:hypothetical protein